MVGSKFITTSNANSVLESALTHFDRRHVFDDLQPYVCIFENCITPNRVFLNRRAWEDHLRQESGSQLDRNTCPLCLVSLPSLQKWRSHVGREMQQLALFAIPKEMYSRDEDDSESDDINESENESVLSQPAVAQALLDDPSQPDEFEYSQYNSGHVQWNDLDNPFYPSEPSSRVDDYLSTMEAAGAQDVNQSDDMHINSRPFPRASADHAGLPEVIGTPMRRSRSHGQSPVPNVHIYTSSQKHIDNRSPSPDPQRRRGSRAADLDDSLDDIADYHRLASHIRELDTLKQRELVERFVHSQ
jgi:hypothetical protein